MLTACYSGWPGLKCSPLAAFGCSVTVGDGGLLRAWFAKVADDSEADAGSASRRCQQEKRQE